MPIKDQVIQVIGISRETELDFINRLTDNDQEEQGDYENWSAKDVVAHVNYWPTVRADQIQAWLDGEGVKPILHFEQSNLQCYELFADKSWDEIEDYARQAHDHLNSVLESLDENKLNGASLDSEDRKMWELIVQVAYTHKLIHYSDFHIRRNKEEFSGRLWSDWAELVSPLDAGEQWQGRVHYNAACGLALAGDRKGAITKLRKSLELQPGMKAWSRRDPDLSILHDTLEFKELITTKYWWEALETNPQIEAVADQFIRAFTMLRAAVETFPGEAWLEGESNYQRPAGLALHIAQTAAMYSSLKPGDSVDDPMMQINWASPDASVFPTQADYLSFLDQVEEKLAWFLVQADFEAVETHFPWTGSTKRSRVLYTLRHTQHHLADMAMELQRRGFQPPDWQ